MGKLVELSLSKKENRKCDNCGMIKKASNDCCKDEHKEVKGEKDQKSVNVSVNQILLPGEALNASYTDLPVVYVPSAILENPSSNAPPEVVRLITIF